MLFYAYLKIETDKLIKIHITYEKERKDKQILELNILFFCGFSILVSCFELRVYECINIWNDTMVRKHSSLYQ